VARASTTSDVFNAVAEARRRDILDALADGEASVGELVERLDLAQPQVSKHLKVLTEVGLVESRARGRHRLYRLDAPALLPVQRWLSKYERLINARYDRLDDYLTRLQSNPEEQSPNDQLPNDQPTKGQPS
jgi:DNA-binding transcriptional ArsR family regulator